MAGKGNGIIKEFKDFISKGNVLDMAVGIIIGSAFTSIVNSLVGDILNPFINTLIGGFSFSGMNVTVKFPWVTALKVYNPELQYPTFYFGYFISAIISFLVTAVAVFFIIKGVNAIKNIGKKKEAEAAPAEPTTKMCPYCRSEISIEATRCPHCTSQL